MVNIGLVQVSHLVMANMVQVKDSLQDMDLNQANILVLDMVVAQDSLLALVSKDLA